MKGPKRVLKGFASRGQVGQALHKKDGKKVRALTSLAGIICHVVIGISFKLCWRSWMLLYAIMLPSQASQATVQRLKEYWDPQNIQWQSGLPKYFSIVKHEPPTKARWVKKEKEFPLEFSFIPHHLPTKNHRKHLSSSHPHSFGVTSSMPWEQFRESLRSRRIVPSFWWQAWHPHPTKTHLFHATCRGQAVLRVIPFFPEQVGVFLFWWERNYQFTGWSLGCVCFFSKETYSGEWKFHSKVDGWTFCWFEGFWFGECLLQKTPLLVGALDFVYQLVSFRRSEMRCWDCWDVFFEHIHWFWEFDMQPQNFSRYPSTYIILENDNTDHVPTCFPPQLHIDSLLWRSLGKYMLPQRYLIAAVPENIRAPCRSAFVIKGSLDEKLPSYELLKMLKVIDSQSNRFAK